MQVKHDETGFEPFSLSSAIIYGGSVSAPSVMQER